jgi:hypothetical protein
MTTTQNTTHDPAWWAPTCVAATVSALTDTRREDLTKRLHDHDIIAQIEAAGFQCERIWEWDCEQRSIEGRKRATVREVCNNITNGAYYLSVKGHAMALVDGILTDTADRGVDGRDVLYVWKVTAA